QPLAIESAGIATSFPDERDCGSAFAAALCVPLVAGGQAIGVVRVDRLGPGPAFDMEETRALEGFAASVGQTVGLPGERQRDPHDLRSARLEALGLLAGGVAHDFNNLLTAIRGRADMLARRMPAGTPDRRSAEEVVRSVERATALTRRLLMFGRQQVARPGVLVLEDVLEEMQDVLLPLIGENIHVVTAGRRERWPVWADRGQVEQVVLNLAINARDAMPRGGTLTLELTTAEVDAGEDPGPQPGRYVVLRISDTGCGMD